MNRRMFAGRTTAILAAGIAPAIVRGQNLNSKLQHASVGVGGMGWNDVRTFNGAPNCEIAAVCDVDANILNRAGKTFSNARRYADWREMLATEGDRIDSVNVTVPDHNHFIISASALAAGKHVYCQKPLCHELREVRVLTELAARKDLVTQIGTQHASSRGERSAIEMLRAGVIGKVRRVVCNSNRPGNSPSKYRMLGPRPEAGVAPPDPINWDLWIGTAPERPFVPNIYHRESWRSWQDFGTGWLGDIGCHLFSGFWKGLDLQAPESVRAEVEEAWRDSPERRAQTWPIAQKIFWTFPGNDYTGGDPLTVEWYDGPNKTPEDALKMVPLAKYPHEASLMIGDKGVMLLPLGGGAYLYPEDTYKTFKRPRYKSQDHYENFVDACLGKAEAERPFAIAGPMTEAVLTGTVAVRLPETKLSWNAKALAFSGNDAANAMIARDYRDGWGSILQFESKA